MKLIKLHSYHNGIPIYINIDTIVTMNTCTREGEDSTFLQLISGMERVKEDIPTILSKL